LQKALETLWRSVSAESHGLRNLCRILLLLATRHCGRRGAFAFASPGVNTGLLYPNNEQGGAANVTPCCNRKKYQQCNGSFQGAVFGSVFTWACMPQPATRERAPDLVLASCGGRLSQAAVIHMLPGPGRTKGFGWRRPEMHRFWATYSLHRLPPSTASLLDGKPRHQPTLGTLARLIYSTTTCSHCLHYRTWHHPPRRAARMCPGGSKLLYTPPEVGRTRGRRRSNKRFFAAHESGAIATRRACAAGCHRLAR
jgi:hypothetical protein